MRIRFAVVLASVLFLWSGSASGQGSFSLDHVDGLLNTDTVSTDVPITFYLRWTNNTGANIRGCSNGFEVYSPDGAVWDPITWVPYRDFSQMPPVVVEYYPGWSTIIFDNSLDFNPYGVTGSGADTIGFSGTKKYGTGVVDGFDDVVYTISTIVNDAQHGKTLCLDSCFYPPANDWVWSGDTVDPVNPGTGDIYPGWGGPYCFFIRDPDYVPPSNLVLSTDSLHYLAIDGGPNPVYQSFDVNTDNDPLSFTASEGVTWLQVNPTGGTTPETINVYVNIAGLAVGTYYTDVTINSPAAENSPQRVVVKLEIIPPPPEISVNPTSFQFFAVVDEDNPEPKTLTIKNVGASILNWTVTNTESWLSLDPLSGVDSADVTVSVDIAGLAYGDYFDSIVVSDPLAINDPVKVPVRLTMGSNLPVIEVDSAFNYIIVEEGGQTTPGREILIRNGGIGLMNFWLTDNSSRLASYTPSSGSAPQTVMVDFKTIGGVTGTDYYDTLWVYSNEAVNSPFPVVFLFHYVEEAAFLYVDVDSIDFDVYRCDQGAGVGNPWEQIYVYNSGGDDPVQVNLLFDSELFEAIPPSATAPRVFTIRAFDPLVEAGTYYDTILVSAINAINSPQTVIVKTIVRDGTIPPRIHLETTELVFNIKAGSPAPVPILFPILNRFGGCMEWELVEDVPWMTASNLSGDVPGETILGFDIGGFGCGSYTDSFLVYAPSASNSPQKVSLELNVWNSRGDCNFNCKVNIADVVYLTNYLFYGGPEPQPEWKIGDVNCNEAVNISDMVYLLVYLYHYGPPPCEEP